MPRYELEIHEPDGSITTGDHTTPEGEWMQPPEFFEYEGRELRAVDAKAGKGPYDQVLVCAVP